MSYLRGACGLNRMDNDNIESVYGKLVWLIKNEGMNCGMVQVFKRQVVCHLERIVDELTEDLQE